MHPALVVVLLVIVAVGTYALFALFHPNEVDAAGAPKRFGLKEAEAAARYVSTADAAQPVMAVIVGVLGYDNMVADDLAEATATNDRLNTEALGEVAEKDAEIADLKHEISLLKAEVGNRLGELAEKQRVAALFNV